MRMREEMDEYHLPYVLFIREGEDNKKFCNRVINEANKYGLVTRDNYDRIKRHCYEGKKIIRIMA